MESEDIVANLKAEQRKAEENNTIVRLQAENMDDEMDDESMDEGIEFVDPSLGHIMHFMSLLDLLSTPAPKPQPVYRP